MAEGKRSQQPTNPFSVFTHVLNGDSYSVLQHAKKRYQQSTCPHISLFLCTGKTTWNWTYTLLAVMRTSFFCCLLLVIPPITRALFLSPSPSLDETQVQGHRAASSLPAPLSYVPSFLSRDDFSFFFPRRLASKCANLIPERTLLVVLKVLV